MANLGFPSRNLTGDDTLVGLFGLFKAKLLQNMDDMLPAKVIAYDRATNRAQVQPLIVMVDTLGNQVQRAQIASLPVLQIGGGGFVVSFPIKTGDLGWIKANDRDISLFKANYEQAAPNTQRKHSFEDALFIPDSFMQDVIIDPEDAENLVIQNLDGTVKISWWSNLLKLLAATIRIITPNLFVNSTDIQVTTSTMEIIASTVEISAQVGIGGTPDANAILDLQSTTAAFILPRMTTLQRNAIPSPSAGMVVYNITTGGISSYNGAIWS